MSAIQSCAHHYGVIGGGIPQHFASAVDRDKWKRWQGDGKEKTTFKLNRTRAKLKIKLYLAEVIHTRSCWGYMRRWRRFYYMSDSTVTWQNRRKQPLWSSNRSPKNRRKWHTWGRVRVVCVGIWCYQSGTDREVDSQWGGGVRVKHLGAWRGDVCVYVFREWRSLSLRWSLCCTLGKTFGVCQQRTTCRAWGMWAAPLSMLCLTPSSHPIMDLGCGPSAVLSKHYFCG